MINPLAQISALVPTLRVGMPSSTLLRRLGASPRHSEADAERPGRHSHAERGNEFAPLIRRVVLGLFLTAMILDGGSGVALAQAGSTPSPNLEGFTVAGKGSVAAKPNRLEIDLEISASSEMTSDVIVKYRDAKKRIQEAFTALKMANVTVEERALAVDQKGQVFNPYMMDTPPARKGKVEVQLSRKLVVNCTNIRDMDEEAILQLVARLLDVAQDAGAKVGGGGDFNPYSYRWGASNNTALVRFILDDYDPLLEKAYQAAVVDARTRASRLAKLSGLELGAIGGVREVLVPGEKTQNNSSPYFYYDMPSTEEESPKKQLTASKFQEIPIKVELQVRFTTTPAKAAAGGGQ